MLSIDIAGTLEVAEAVARILGFTPYSIERTSDDEHVLRFPSKNIEDGYTYPDEEAIATEVLSVTAGKKQQAILTKIIQMADMLHESFKDTLAARNVTPGQQERYITKAEIAKTNKALLADEAVIVGVSIDMLAGMIIQMADTWKVKTEVAVSKIEALRIKLNAMAVSGDMAMMQKACYIVDAVMAANAIPDGSIVDYVDGLCAQYDYIEEINNEENN